VPAIAGAGVFEMKDALAAVGEDGWAALALGTMTAAVAGYLSIAWLLRYLARRTLAPFCAYRIVIAIALVALLAGGVVPALLPAG
jgi:undecaprenyl-diphosphatase